MYNAPVVWWTVRWLKAHSRRSGWKLVKVCPLHKVGITKSQQPSRALITPTFGPGDEVLLMTRRPSISNGSARRQQGKQREWTRRRRGDTFAFMLLKAHLQVKVSQRSSHVSEKENKKEREEMLELWSDSRTLRRKHSWPNGKHSPLEMSLLEKGQSSSSVRRWAVENWTGGVTETMAGSLYGAHSKGVAGQGRTMQEREAGYSNGN